MVKIEISNETLMNLGEFLSRVTLTGKEVSTFNDVIKELNNTLTEDVKK